MDGRRRDEPTNDPELKGKTDLVVLIVEIEVTSEDRDEFLAAIQRQADLSRQLEDGCLRFEIVESRAQENRFVLFEVYSDEESFRMHRDTNHYAEWSSVSSRVVVDRSVEEFGPVRVEGL